MTAHVPSSTALATSPRVEHLDILDVVLRGLRDGRQEVHEDLGRGMLLVQHLRQQEALNNVERQMKQGTPNLWIESSMKGTAIQPSERMSPLAASIT